jgi:hypothetical protein
MWKLETWDLSMRFVLQSHFEALDRSRCSTNQRHSQCWKLENLDRSEHAVLVHELSSCGNVFEVQEILSRRHPFVSNQVSALTLRSCFAARCGDGPQKSFASHQHAGHCPVFCLQIIPTTVLAAEFNINLPPECRFEGGFDFQGRRDDFVCSMAVVSKEENYRVFREFGSERFLRLQVHSSIDAFIFGGKGHAAQKQHAHNNGNTFTVSRRGVQFKDQDPGIETFRAVSHSDKTLWTIGSELKSQSNGERGCFYCRFKRFLSSFEYLGRQYAFVHAKEKHFYVWAEEELSQEAFLTEKRQCPTPAVNIRNWHIPPEFNCVVTGEKMLGDMASNENAPFSGTKNAALTSEAHNMVQASRVSADAVHATVCSTVLPGMTIHKYKARSVYLLFVSIAFTQNAINFALPLHPVRFSAWTSCFHPQGQHRCVSTARYPVLSSWRDSRLDLNPNDIRCIRIYWPLFSALQAL